MLCMVASWLKSVGDEQEVGTKCVVLYVKRVASGAQIRPSGGATVTGADAQDRLRAVRRVETMMRMRPMCSKYHCAWTRMFRDIENLALGLRGSIWMTTGPQQLGSTPCALVLRLGRRSTYSDKRQTGASATV